MILGSIIIAISFVILVAIAIFDYEELPIMLAGFLLGMFCLWGIALCCSESDKEQTEFKYPTTEYTLEYEVIIRGEQIDSTYVISKIE